MHSLFRFIFSIVVITITSSNCDRLDELLSKHWHRCGQSLHQRRVSSITTSSLTASSNHIKFEDRFDFFIKPRVTCSLESNGHLKERIVGGIEAERFEFPWQISLRRYSPIFKKWYHSCGGVIIDSKWILTAAHCVLGSKDPEEYRIRIGEHNYSLNEGMEVDLNVSKIIAHSGFNIQTIEPDICLIKLSEDISFGPESNFRPICFPRVSKKISTDLMMESKPKCVSTGWGKTVFHGEFPKVLQKVCVDLVDIDDCRRRYKEIINVTDTMICSGKGGKGTCEGDSGGPLQCIEKTLVQIKGTNSKVINKYESRWFLYGVTSWAIGCAEDQFPSVATNIAALRDWIATQL